MYLDIILPAFFPDSRPMILCYMMCHVTTVTYLFIIQEIKIKSKRKEKKKRDQIEENR